MASMSFVFPKTDREIIDTSLEISVEEQRQEAFDQGLKEGYQAGYEKALKQAREELTVATVQLNNRIEQLSDGVADFNMIYQKESHVLIANLVRTCCESALRQELSQGPEALAAMVKNGVEKLDARSPVRVKMNDVEAKFLTDFVADWGEGVTLSSEEGMSVGECILETDSQLLELNSEKQLNECIELVMAHFNELN